VDIALQIFKDFGITSVAAVIVGLLVVWFVSHIVAQPGAQVSIMWGMIQYTKKKGASPLESPRVGSQTRIYSSDSQQSTISTLVPRSVEGPTALNSEDKRLFVPGSPFPSGFNVVKPGSRLSLAKATYPSPPAAFGHIHGSPYYEVSLPDGPFKRVSYYFHENETDPVIDQAVFYFRDESSEKQVREQALSALGTRGLKSVVSGALIWESIGEFWVDLNPNRSYRVARK
jgi:hypothetical protein